MEARRVGNDDALRFDHQTSGLIFSGGSLGQNQGQHRVPSSIGKPHVRAKLRHPVAVRHHNLGQQTAGLLGHIVGVKLNQNVPSFDAIAHLHLGGKALPLQGHGIQANVHQDFNALGGFHRHRMVGAVELHNFPITGGQKRLTGGVDGNAVAHHLLGKDRIGHGFDGHQLPRQRSHQHQYLGFGGGGLHSGHSGVE